MKINTEKLKNPPVTFRPANYWGWLGDISPDEAAWQVEQMHNAGLGGYVPHSRGGREIPYMGEEWLDSVESIVQTGDKYGMMTIMDDEDGWPSGFGGGYVTSKGPAYHVKWLVCEEVEFFNAEEENDVKFLGFFTAGDKKVKISYGTSQYYSDNMDEKVVDAFIEAGYDSYYKRFGSRFYGIFSDEPQLAREHIPWSDTIPAKFMERYGYDIKANLSAIFCEVDGYEKVRFDYWQLVSELFEKSYGKKIGDWCRAHDIIFTGHTTCEESLTWQMKCTGSTMQFYEWFDMPGMDWLGRVGVSNMAIKQLTSVSEQTGKARTLSEMYGCAGWNVGFDDMKWIGEWHFVHGVNFMLQHLGLYSLKGSRKREYPASLFYQQPWWDDYGFFNDYFARLSVIVAEGKPQIDVLVLHPMSSIWTMYNESQNDALSAIENSFKNLSSRLMDLNYNFHYGDDAVMKRHIKTNGNRLHIGEYEYQTVVMPETTNIASVTLDILLTFASNGGVILSVGSFPHLVDGRGDSAKLTSLKQAVIAYTDAESLLADMGKYSIRPVTLNREGSEYPTKIYSRSMMYEGNLCHFIVNTNNDVEFAVSIEAQSGKKLKKLNIETCEFEVIDAADYTLRPTESLMLFETDESLETPKKSVSGGEKMDLNGSWEIKSCTENSLVLDMCAYSFDGENFEDEIFVLKLQQKLLREKQNRDVTMKFTFESAFVPGNCCLLVEEPDKFEIIINGKSVDKTVIGYHYDKNFKKIPIEKYIVAGRNTITLKRYFYLSDRVYEVKNNHAIHEAESNRITFETELEAIYLLGNFTVSVKDGTSRDGSVGSMFVKGRNVISPPQTSVNVNDLTSDGFPYFAGRINLAKEIDHAGGSATLVFNHPDATLVKASVNGEAVTTLCWEPFTADIGSYLKIGKNVIEIELVNSLRNLLGPHHNKSGEVLGVGPHSFGVNEQSWNEEYNIVRFGAGSDVTIVRE